MIKFRKRQKAGFWQLRILERLARAQHHHDWTQRDLDRYQDSLYEQFHALINLEPNAKVPPALLARLEKELPVRPPALESPREVPLSELKPGANTVLASR